MPTAEEERDAKNISPGKPGIPSWNSNDVNGSLQEILIYVESEANRSINWYWRSKRSKAAMSQIIRFTAFSLTALAGLFPIAVLMLNPFLKSVGVAYEIPDKGLVASLFVGIAAGLFGLDKAFGFSSGWTRYVLTATLLEKTLEEFRLHWTLLRAEANQTPTLDQIEALLKCAQDFRVAVSTAVLQETKDWVTEFQNNLGELERDTRAQLDLLRASIEKRVAAETEESRPGAVELTVTDAASAQDFVFEVNVESEKGIVLTEAVRNTKTWAAVGIAPGQYRLRLVGKVGGREATVTKVLIVKPNETTVIQAQLAV